MPAQVGRRATPIARRKSNALVLGIRPDVHRAPFALIEVDLDRVAGRVAEEASLVPLVRHRIVQPRLGKGENRDRLLSRRELRQQRDGVQ